MVYDKLIIVESPAKAKTIENFIDKAIVLASKGHIMELQKYNSTGIKVVDGKYIPIYTIEPGHKKIVENILHEAKDKKVYIATDEDREGEAIGYNIATLLGKAQNIDPLTYDRIVFHEITKSAINKALENPRKLHLPSIHAQQARRMLDRLVGFKLSGLIIKKVGPGLSAGRVQSAALKILSIRDNEIKSFIPEKYFEFPTKFKTNLPAELIEYKNEKVAKQSIKDENTAKEILEAIKKDSYKITSIEDRNRSLSPKPPFMTSTLQQSASSELGFDPKKTMNLAQKLYEGVDTQNGRHGVITYMRTDSLNLADEAILAIRAKIGKVHGQNYLPNQPRKYASKSKGAQEAHEAIRVTDVEFTPEIASKYLDKDQLKLYTLIYNRFMMCQMSDCVVANQTVSVTGNTTKFKISGRKVIFDGWTKLSKNTKEDVILPSLEQGQDMYLESVQLEEKYTEPPNRYNEASLVKTLEDLGIGRPSTYATIISILKDRQYVRVDNKQLHVTDKGEQVVKFLDSYFDNITDSKFTSKMEEQLDDIAHEKIDMHKVLHDFWDPMDLKIKNGYTNIPSQRDEKMLDETCPECNHLLMEKQSKYGKFVCCSNYPTCKWVKKKDKPVVEPIGAPCPDCGKPVYKRTSKYNTTFYGCSGYPKCKFISKFPVATNKCSVCGHWLQEITSPDGSVTFNCLKCNPVIKKKKGK